MKASIGRKLGRTSSHRRALLRNLVTSLIAHERISTTVAKAKEAQRVAEKIITKAKKANLGSVQQGIQARDFLFPNPVQASYPRLLELAKRYADRPGGYTRLHLHGHRQGDHAPRALLELVDNPRDLRMEMTARALAQETFQAEVVRGEAPVKLSQGIMDWLQDPRFSSRTRANVARVTKYRGEDGAAELVEKAANHTLRLRARDQIEDAPRRVDRRKVDAWGDAKPIGGTLTLPMTSRATQAGRTPRHKEEWQPSRYPPNRPNSVIRLGKAAFANRQRPRVIMPAQSKRLPKRAEVKA